MKKKILLFYPSLSSFVKKDVEFLSSKYEVADFSFLVRNKILTPFIILKQILFLLKNVWNSKLIVCEFASHHSLMPVLFSRLFNKPSLVILGGTDAVSFPSISYGNFNKRMLSFSTKWSLKLATHLAPKHESLVYSDYTYQAADFSKQGYKYFIPDIKTPYTVINNGYNSDYWGRRKDKVKNRFITVVSGLNKRFTKKLKGIDLIVEVAPLFPDCDFVILGVPVNYDLGEKSENIIRIPYVKNSKLPEYYSEAEFYLQLSISEGFPNALCEAMLCECIPIVSNVGAMPEIVSESGFVLTQRNSLMLREIIQRAIVCDKNLLSTKARMRIVSKYPESKRRNDLLLLVENLLI